MWCRHHGLSHWYQWISCLYFLGLSQDSSILKIEGLVILRSGCGLFRFYSFETILLPIKIPHKKNLFVLSCLMEISWLEIYPAHSNGGFSPSGSVPLCNNPVERLNKTRRTWQANANLSENVETIPPLVRVLGQLLEFAIDFDATDADDGRRRSPRDDVTASNQKFGVAAELVGKNSFRNILQRIRQEDTGRANPEDHLEIRKTKIVTMKLLGPWWSRDRGFDSRFPPSFFPLENFAF